MIGRAFVFGLGIGTTAFALGLVLGVMFMQFDRALWLFGGIGG